MNRRQIMIGLVACAAGGLSASAAFAEDLAAGIVRQLKKQGFRKVEVSRTFLGRTRIEAYSGKKRREIILNPRTGEILRDILVSSDESDDDDRIVERSGSGSGSDGNSGKGSGSSDDKSDDKSGGSDNSGKGSSDSGKDDSSDDSDSDDDGEDH